MSRHVNNGGARMRVNRGTRSRAEVMRDFDELPDELRRVFREAPLQLELRSGGDYKSAQYYEVLMEYMAAVSCREAYGESHPQAYRYTPLKRQKVY